MLLLHTTLLTGDYFKLALLFLRAEKDTIQMSRCLAPTRGVMGEESRLPPRTRSFGATDSTAAARSSRVREGATSLPKEQGRNQEGERAVGTAQHSTAPAQQRWRRLEIIGGKRKRTRGGKGPQKFRRGGLAVYPRTP